MRSNTAQVLTTLAETISEGKNVSKKGCDQALGYFQEALEYFNRCLRLQESELSEAEKQADRVNETMSISQDDDAEPAEDFELSASDERWATIIEPVTYHTLTDTINAQLETLTAVCSLAGRYNPTETKRLEEYYSSNLKDKVMVYAGASARQRETWLTRGRFTCALTDAAFRLGLVDITSYERELISTFASLDFSKDPQALCDKADAEVALNLSIGLQLSVLLQSQDLASLNGMRWRILTSALDDLTAASKMKIPNVHNLAGIHLRRGDCELLRYQLGQEPTRYDRAVRSTTVLIKNAGTYYRGAAGFFRNEGATEEEREAIMKEAIAGILSGSSEQLQRIVREREEPESALMEMVEDMKEEGLLSNENVASITELFPGSMTSCTTDHSTL